MNINPYKVLALAILITLIDIGLVRLAFEFHIHPLLCSLVLVLIDAVLANVIALKTEFLSYRRKK